MRRYGGALLVAYVAGTRRTVWIYIDSEKNHGQTRCVSKLNADSREQTQPPLKRRSVLKRVCWENNRASMDGWSCNTPPAQSVFRDRCIDHCSRQKLAFRRLNGWPSIHVLP